MKYQNDIKRFMESGDFTETDGGLLVHSAIMVRGKYTHSVNGGQEERVDYNLLPAEGIKHLLDVCLGATAKTATWYLSLFGNATPAANWTAAGYPVSASEITSGTEGYSETHRQAWVPGVATAGVIGNLASRAEYTIVTASTLDIYGAALHSSQTKGGTAGVLVSASRFANKRTQSNGDTFELGYEVELTDS
jgi:hypothetical protein